MLASESGFTEMIERAIGFLLFLATLLVAVSCDLTGHSRKCDEDCVRISPIDASRFFGVILRDMGFGPDMWTFTKD